MWSLAWGNSNVVIQYWSGVANGQIWNSLRFREPGLKIQAWDAVLQKSEPKLGTELQNSEPKRIIKVQLDSLLTMLSVLVAL